MTAPVMVGPSPQGGGPAVSLADAHLRVLHLAAHGNTDQAIADDMGISRNTVLGYWKILKPRIGAEDRAHACSLAVAAGLVEMRTALVRRPVRPTGGRLGDLLALAEDGPLLAEEVQELKGLVATLERSKRSAGGLHQALAGAREERDTALRASAVVQDRLTRLAGQIPASLLPARRLLVRCADELRDSRPAEATQSSRNAPSKRTS